MPVVTEVQIISLSLPIYNFIFGVYLVHYVKIMGRERNKAVIKVVTDS